MFDRPNVLAVKREREEQVCRRTDIALRLWRHVHQRHLLLQASATAVKGIEMQHAWRLCCGDSIHLASEILLHTFLIQFVLGKSNFVKGGRCIYIPVFISLQLVLYCEAFHKFSGEASPLCCIESQNM